MAEADAAARAARLKADRGPDYFREIGRLGGKATAKRHGRKFLSSIGKRGGRSNAKKGRRHFEEIGAKGGARLRDLVEKGRIQEG